MANNIELTMFRVLIVLEVSCAGITPNSPIVRLLFKSLAFESAIIDRNKLIILVHVQQQKMIENTRLIIDQTL